MQKLPREKGPDGRTDISMGTNGKEGLVVCGDKNLGVGLTIWDIETGDRLLHIPTCASPPFGLTCLRNHYLVASQIHRPGSVGGGVIFTWPLNKVTLYF